MKNGVVILLRNWVVILNWNQVLTLNWNWVVNITGICTLYFARATFRSRSSVAVRLPPSLTVGPQKIYSVNFIFFLRSSGANENNSTRHTLLEKKIKKKVNLSYGFKSQVQALRVFKKISTLIFSDQNPDVKSGIHN